MKLVNITVHTHRGKNRTERKRAGRRRLAAGNRGRPTAPNGVANRYVPDARSLSLSSGLKPETGRHHPEPSACELKPVHASARTRARVFRFRSRRRELNDLDRIGDRIGHSDRAENSEQVKVYVGVKERGLQDPHYKIKAAALSSLFKDQILPTIRRKYVQECLTQSAFFVPFLNGIAIRASPAQHRLASLANGGPRRLRGRTERGKCMKISHLTDLSEILAHASPISSAAGRPASPAERVAHCFETPQASRARHCSLCRPWPAIFWSSARHLFAQA